MRLYSAGDIVLHGQNRRTEAPYLIVAGWGDEFVSLSRLNVVSCAIFLDKILGD
jgi:hypothetical protein